MGNRIMAKFLRIRNLWVMSQRTNYFTHPTLLLPAFGFNQWCPINKSCRNILDFLPFRVLYPCQYSKHSLRSRLCRLEVSQLANVDGFRTHWGRRWGGGGNVVTSKLNLVYQKCWWLPILPIYIYIYIYMGNKLWVIFQIFRNYG